MSEATFQGKVRAYVKARTGAWWKTQDAFRKGLPDSIVCVRGTVTWLEYKYQARATPSGLVYVKLTAEQRSHLREWEAAGGRAFCLLGLGREWYLLRHDVPAKLTVSELDGHAVLRGGDLAPLFGFLSTPPPAP